MNILIQFLFDKCASLYSARRLTIGALCAAVVIACLHPTSALSLVKFDFEQKYFSEKPIEVLDHCVVEQQGEYHLFYLRGNPAVNIGHAKSTDFTNWEILDPVLAPGTWDNRALWAPHLFSPQAGQWYMYYTGVNTNIAQQTGLAISPDLYNWFKAPLPVYHPDPVWAEWDEGAWSHGRDPHVIEYNGKYYMFVTAKTTNNLGAVACAESDNLTNWIDIGPLYVHDTWHVMESVFIMEHAGKFHMLFTEEAVYGTSHISCDSLFGEWNMDNRRIIDTGHAAQVTILSDGTEMFSRHAVYSNGYGLQYHAIRFDQLVWAGDIPAPYKPWGLSPDWTLVWGNAFSYQPTYCNNPAARGENVADTYQGDCWLGTYERYTGPMGFGTPGSFQGEDRTGVIRSIPFTITGESMNLLVGGGNDIDHLYVALVDAATSEVLRKETGKNSDEMDRRYWDLSSYAGREVYIEIADLSAAVFGHINCDDITESMDIVEEEEEEDNQGQDRSKLDNFKTVDGRGETTPAAIGLRQNTPNPFNPTTSIAFELPEQGHVALRVFDVGGKLVKTLVDGERNEGSHAVTWNGLDYRGHAVASGVYLYRLSFQNSVVETKKMMLLK